MVDLAIEHLVHFVDLSGPAKVGGQYIDMLNSDKFEKLEFSEGFDARSRVLPAVLQDASEGRLFGFRFG